MGELNLTRRAFTKLAAVTGAAVACTAAAPNAALAEDAGAAARGDDVKRVRTCCRGCGKMECGVWVTVQNSRRSSRAVTAAASRSRPSRRRTIPIAYTIP